MDTYMIKENYTLCQILADCYLLPYGQNIADHRRGIRLNETSRFLLEQLQEPIEKTALLDRFAHFTEAAPQDYQLLEQDLDDFLSEMRALGILEVCPKHFTPAPKADFCFRIGTLTLGFCGSREHIHPSLWDFSMEAHDAPIDLLVREIPGAPVRHQNGRVLIRTQEVSIQQCEDCYIFQYHVDYGITEARVTLDGSLADFYCTLPYAKELPENLFHAIRFVYLIRAQRAGLFAIHSASVQYEGKALLFSASSGTGKSTHAALWKKLYDVSDLNGDLNLLGFEDGIPVVYGIPWCGTSGIYTTKKTPLLGIVFLKQAATDHLEPMTDSTKILRIADRLISPAWTMEQLSKNLAFATKLSPKIQTHCLHCTMEDSAAALIRQQIDMEINGKP